MSDKKHSLTGTIISSILALLVVSAGLWLFFNRAYAQDQLSVWGYDPPANVVELGEDIGLTAKGRFYFYASSPQINGATEFNANCPQREVNNPILGCYSSKKIYVYDVTEDDLEGIKEVTAAHEMLHAVWERHSEDERERIGALLKTAYNNLHDQALETRMAYYERNEPGEYLNELHSIIGTEASSIGDELEAYYDDYFQDRKKIVAFHDQYDSIFTELRAEYEALYGDLNTLGDEITSDRARYEATSSQLGADIDSFNERANNGSFSSTTAFYNERNSLTARSNQLEGDRAQLNAKIASYNQKYEHYQTLASRIQQLNSSIDSMADVDDAPRISD